MFSAKQAQHVQQVGYGSVSGWCHTGGVGIVIILSRHRMYTDQDGYGTYLNQNRHGRTWTDCVGYLTAFEGGGDQKDIQTWARGGKFKTNLPLREDPIGTEHLSF